MPQTNLPASNPISTSTSTRATAPSPWGRCRYDFDSHVAARTTTGGTSARGGYDIQAIDGTPGDGAQCEDPKGAGQTFGPTPPLTPAQMTAIVTSDKWAQG